MDWQCCWNRERIGLGDCPNIHEDDVGLLESNQRRLLEKCSSCKHFIDDMNRFLESGHPLAPVFITIHSAFQRQRSQIDSLVSFLDSKTLEVRFLHELGSILQTSVDLEEVLSVALTAITAGKGFGMNRAFLLIANPESGVLQGHLAIGPRSYEEANRTWDEISRNDMDLQTLAQNFRNTKLTSERAKFHDILEQLSVSLAESSHPLIRALNGAQPLLVEDAFHNPDISPGIANLLGVDSFLVMPLITRSRRVGIIIADNCITHRPITEEDMRSLENFAFPVAFAIERAFLYERLQEELKRVTEAGNKLRLQQELLVKMEKMALVGRITSTIAHSIRNPLMVIGGFARSILKNTPDSDPKRNFIESIVGEARHLESVLDEILNYSNSLYPTRDFWDVNQLMDTSLREIQGYLLDRDSSCSFEPKEGLPLVYIDFKQVAYCVRTLIMNTLEGRSGENITACAEQEAGTVRIIIRDRGRSVGPEELDELLTPFSITQTMGSGLGLALCRSMLEKQEIPFLVIAPPEGGISYIITLPIQKEEPYEQTPGG